MIITDTIKYVGVNDHVIDLFEGQYIVPNGISYNSYAVIDEKIAIMDSVDARFADEWLDNIKNTLGDRKPDYLIVQHMEPDHSSSIVNFVEAYPDAKKWFQIPGESVILKNHNRLCLYESILQFQCNHLTEAHSQC